MMWRRKGLLVVLYNVKEEGAAVCWWDSNAKEEGAAGWIDYVEEEGAPG